jgi:hypothetical protein
LKRANHFWAVLSSNGVSSVDDTDVSCGLCSFGASTELVYKKVSEVFMFLNLTLRSFEPGNFVPLAKIGKFQNVLIEEDDSYRMAYYKSQHAILVEELSSKTKPARTYAPTRYKHCAKIRGSE